MTDVNLTSPVDPVNVCILAEYFMGIICLLVLFSLPFYSPPLDTSCVDRYLLHVAALYENKIYSIGGLSEINANLLDDRPGMPTHTRSFR